MLALTEHCLMLFEDQKSSFIFSLSATATAEKDAQSASVNSILLSRCHAAFLQEIASLDARLQHLLAIDSALFFFPRDLLKPIAQYHTHAVLQTITIYLCQLLHYLAKTQRVDESFKNSFDRLRETANFSSGLLSTTIVARLRSLNDFVTSEIEKFRLVF